MNAYFSDKELEQLIAHQGKPAVSIYLPTTRISTRVQAESLQFKNLIRDAEDTLTGFELRGADVRAMLEPARELIGNTEFWRHQKDGLAVFIAENTFVVHQVPVTFEANMIVGEAFHLKPLMPLLTHEFVFYVLAISQNQVRFLRCTRYAAQEIDPASVPESLQEILNEYTFDRELQFHTSTSTPRGTERAAIYHGTGSGAGDDEKARLREFFDRIDRGIQDYLRDQNAPLVFAGVDYLFPIYQEANSYPHLIDSNVSGNPDALPADELQKRAWRLIEPNFVAGQQDDIERFHAAAAQEMAATDLREIVAWADQGRVQTVFLDKQAEVWGRYDREKFEVHVDAESDLHNRDLTDLAGIYTLLRGGNVYLLSPQAMEMEFGPDNRHQGDNGSTDAPAQTPVAAAIYRYAI